jgi:hypothetical protein
MRLPRPRFTVRRLMIAVAIVAVGLWGWSFGVRSYRDFLTYLQLQNNRPIALDLWLGRARGSRRTNPTTRAGPVKRGEIGMWQKTINLPLP